MITIKDLPQDQWSRLKDHESLGGYPLPDPRFHRAVIAEDEGKIVAVWFLIQVVHLEPIWIDPAYRNGILPGRMFNSIKRLLDSCSVKEAYCFSDTPAIAGYLERLGMIKMPYDTYKYEVPPCPQQ